MFEWVVVAVGGGGGVVVCVRDGSRALFVINQLFMFVFQTRNEVRRSKRSDHSFSSSTVYTIAYCDRIRPRSHFVYDMQSVQCNKAPMALNY